MGAVGTAAANLAASEQNLQETRLVLRERIQSFWAQRQSAIDRMAASQSQIRTAKAVVVAYRQQFEVGRRSLLDLLNIQSDLFSYQSNRALAEFDAKLARARLMAATGQLANAYLNSPPPKIDTVGSTNAKGSTVAGNGTKGLAASVGGAGSPGAATGLRGGQSTTVSSNWMYTQ